MKRREFFRTSAGLLALSIAPGVWAFERPVYPKKKFKISKYEVKNSLAPILKLTPDDGFYLHTYYDVTPWSPSQRYFVVTKIPFQDRLPVFGDTAEICVIDLQEETIETIYKTKSWGFQTASNVNWGETDRHLYLNDSINGKTVCVRVDRESKDVKAFVGPMYHVAPDESCVISFPQEYWAVTQLGLGTPPKDYDNLPSLPPGAAKNEGIWRTDLKANTKKLLVSLADAAAVVPEKPPRDDYTYYFWHSKFNPQGTRVLQVLRCIFPGFDGKSEDRNPLTITFNSDGSNIKFSLPDFRPVWGNGGGHPHWEPNGEYITRILKMPDGKNYFVEFRYDGADFKQLCTKVKGTGHPSTEPSGKYIVTDSKSGKGKEQVCSLRLVDIPADEEAIVCSLPTIDWKEKYTDSVFRVDGHPSWDRDYKQVAFQAAPGGIRQVFAIDLSHLLV